MFARLDDRAALPCAAALVAVFLLTPPCAADDGGYTLEQIVLLARSANPTLAASDAAVRAAEGVLDHSGRYPNPELSLTAGRGRPRDGGDRRWENGLELDQPFELPGLRRSRRRVAQAELLGVEAERRVDESGIVAAASRLFALVLLEQRRVEIASESAEIAGRLSELLEARVDVGESSPLEALKARTEWYARRAELLDGESALDGARAALRAICGGALVGDFRLSEAAKEESIELPEDLHRRLLEHQPSLARAALAVEEAEAVVELARARRFPGFDLSIGHETELDRTATTFGLGLQLPLWNRRRGEIAAAEAQVDVAAARARGLELELRTELEREMARYRSSLASLRLHQDGWSQSAAEALEIATFSYENGEGSLLDVLDAQRSYLAVRLAEAEARADLAFARVEIERLVGGDLVRRSTASGGVARMETEPEERP